jgi:hypothetical protein
MSSRSETTRSIRALEATVDAVYSAAVPSGGVTNSKVAWGFVTAIEDVLRLLIVDPQNQTPLQVFARINNAKYALKHGLMRIIRSNSVGDLALPVEELEGPEYLRAIEFFALSNNYHVASIVFSLIHSAAVVPHVRGNTVRMPVRAEERELLVRDLVEAIGQPAVTPFVPLVSWLRGGPAVDPIVRWASECPSLPGGFAVEVVRPPGLLHRVLAAIPAARPLIPPAWKWRTHSAATVRSVLHSLQALCLHHIIANWWSAIRMGMCGMGLSSAVPLVSRRDLEALLVSVSGQSPQTVADVADLLSYGSKTRTPDPALEPFIPVGASLLMIPPLLTLSNDLERNFLALLARAYPNEFDPSSHAFEDDMVAALERSASRFPQKSRFFVPERRDAGEVDLVLADKETRHVLVCELRWMLPAGELRELFHRRNAGSEKVTQVRTKTAAVRERLEQVLTALSLDAAEAHTWRVEPLVVLDGCTAASEPDVQVVTRRMLEVGLARTHGIPELLTWLKSDAFRPRNGVHYRDVYLSLVFGGVRLEHAAVELLPQAAELLGQPGDVFPVS